MRSGETVLVLNTGFTPINYCSAERAMSMLVSGVAKALDKQYQMFDFDSWADLAAEYGDSVVRTPNRTIVVPKIIVVQGFNRLPRMKMRFSRQNIMLRDNFQCQYCGVTFTRSKLNLDHVVPRRQGGVTSWENIVTSCYPCNTYKADLTPGEAGMRLLRKPTKPTWFSMAKRRGSVPPKEWLPFLDPVDAAYWNAELKPE